MNSTINISAWLRMFRMKRSTSAYEPRWLSIPSVLIAIMWMMLWLLWPHGEKLQTVKTQVMQSPRVAFVPGGENIYSKPLSFNTWKTSDESGEPVPVMPWLMDRPARCLEKNISIVEEYASGRMAGIYGHVLRGMESYKPVWEDVPVFNISTNSQMRLTVETMGDLKVRGFKLPDFLSEIKKNDKSWMITVFVEVDKDGNVDKVFLDSGSEYKEINSIVVKSIYRGRVSVAGTRCEGRVRLNYGAN